MSTIKRLLVESLEETFELFVNDDQNLDDSFVGTCVDTGQQVTVLMPWNVSIESVPLGGDNSRIKRIAELKADCQNQLIDIVVNNPKAINGLKWNQVKQAMNSLNNELEEIAKNG